MDEPEGRPRQALDLHGCGMLFDPDVQQGLSRLPIGCRKAAFSLDLDAVGTAFGSRRKWMRPTIEQDDQTFGDSTAGSGELAADRGLALADAAVREGGGEQDDAVGL